MHPSSTHGVVDRFLIPLCLALAVMVVSRALYLNADHIGGQALYRVVAVLAGMFQFASVVFVAAFVYPVAYFRGATPGERVTAASANLAVWVVLDAHDLTEAFPCVEAIYYGVNIGSILFAWNLALIGLLELGCRWASKKKGSSVSILTPLPFVPIVLFVFVALGLSIQGGAAYFNMLLDGYLLLFRN